MARSTFLLTNSLILISLVGVGHAKDTLEYNGSKHLIIDSDKIGRLLLLNPKTFTPLDVDNVLGIRLIHVDQDSTPHSTDRSATTMPSRKIDLYIWRNLEDVVSLNLNKPNGHAITLTVTTRPSNIDEINNPCVLPDEAKVLALKNGWETLSNDSNPSFRKKPGYTVNFRFDHKCLSVINFVYGISFPIP